MLCRTCRGHIEPVDIADQSAGFCPDCNCVDLAPLRAVVDYPRDSQARHELENPHVA